MPRYPFQPAILDALPEELVELFRGLELTLLQEICSRLKIADNLNEVTVQDIRALRAMGIDLEEIKKDISDATGTGMDKLNALLDDVVARNQAYYTEIVDLAQVTAPERLIDQEDIYAIYEQTKGQYRNITQSMGFLVREGRHMVMLPPAKAYQHCLDSAELQVMSGAISYNQAIASAVKELAESGLKTVSYESGHVDSVDVAVRRAVMTGVNQLNQKYREQSMDYLETDLVEVTAHLGARNIDGPNGWENHAAWQGGVYRWSDKPRASKGHYPDFVEKCGYGSVTGIGGANCRHSYWPYIEGVSERTYTDAELEAMKPENRPKIEFEGKEYDDYQATQMQRRVEREIRKQKRLKTAYGAAGLTEDAQAANARLRRLNQKYKAFSEAAGLPEQRERMRVQYVDDASTAKAAAVLESRSKSGIIVQKKSKEIPEVGKASAPRKPAAMKDVTEEYLDSATPNSHTVQDLQAYTVNGTTYKVDGHNVVLDYSHHEKEIAEFLERTLGGEIFMVPRVNEPQGVSTSDYLFRGKRFDLKSPEGKGKNTLYDAIAKKAEQADNFVFDLSKCPLSAEEVDRQLAVIGRSTHTEFVKSIIIIKDKKIIRILERDKKQS